jgi:hypothetical protein
MKQDSTIPWDVKALKIEALPNPIMVAVKKVNAYTIGATITQPDGKLPDTVKAAVSRDKWERSVHRGFREQA